MKIVRLLNTVERLLVRKSQNKHCVGPRCDRYLKRSEFHVDHIIPRVQGGTNDPSNLQALCITCHMKKTRQENSTRMTGAIRLSKAERSAFGLKKAWIVADKKFL